MVLEYIAVMGFPQMENLIAMLRNTSLDSRSRARRLDIVTLRQGLDPSQVIRPFLELLSLLPNLEVLHIGDWFVTVLEDDEALGAHITQYLPRIKRLNCHHVGSAGYFSPIISRYTHLVGLQSFAGFWATSQIDKIENKTLTTLVLTFLSVADLPLHGIRLPALRHLEAGHLGDNKAGLLRFLDRHGPQLASISLGYDRQSDELEKEILDRCPFVDEFLRDASYPPTEQLSDTYPTITRFGLTGSKPPTVEYIHDVYHLDRFPNLNIIRLLYIEYQPPPQRYNRETMESVADSRRRVMLEDVHGSPIPGNDA